MSEIKKGFKIGKILRYFIFIFAFVCLGFSVESYKVEAAPEISIPTDDYFDYNSGLSFYVGYDVLTVNSVKYSFDNSNWTSISNPASKGSYTDIYNGDGAKSLCSSKSFISTCTGVILEYHLTNLPNSKSNGVNDNGKFTIYVQASNKKGILGGPSDAEQTLTYDGTSPVVSSVTVNDLKKSLKQGDTISFNVIFSESVKVSGTDAKIKFKIGTAEKYASCGVTTGYNQSVTCKYTVASSDNGSISGLELVGATGIVDQYSNKASNGVINNVDTKKVVVDTTKPYITSIISNGGMWSYGKELTIEVAFNENLVKVTSDANYPSLKVKFGDGEEKTCSFSNTVGSKIYYVCSVGNSDQGALNIISLTGDTTFSDSAGNYFNLTIPEDYKTLSNVVADNNMPALNSISVEASECFENKYCKTNEEISVRFNFNGKVEIVNRDIKLYFGETLANSSYKIVYDQNSGVLNLVYAIVSGDLSGQMKINYSFEIKGENGLVNSFSGSKLVDVYVDNLSPSLQNLKVISNGQEVNGNVIYSAEGKEIIFEVDVKETSEVLLDATKIYLVDADNNRIYTSAYSISNVNVQLDGKKIIVTVKIGSIANVSLKLKVEKEALKDSLGNTLFEDYYSEIYLLDCNVPNFELEVRYPEYKGYRNGESWMLISGNEIQFVIESEDKDLKDYCVYINNDSDCHYEELVLDAVNTYEFSGDLDKSYSFYVKVRDTSDNYYVKKMEFILKDLFSYSKELGSISNEHSITVDTSILLAGDMFKYSWFKEGSRVSFDNAYNSVKTLESDEFTVDGLSTYNGKYRVCLNVVKNDLILCSEYVTFDTKIDTFNVSIPTSWTNNVIKPEIVFNDISAIKCIAIGKNVSSLDCVNGGVNKAIYKTAQISNPFNKYEINENGVYYFYIEDMIGNSKIISKTVTNIDTENVVIEIFKNSEYDTNLEIDVYKNSHSFFMALDRNKEGSPIKEYKYFYSKSSYDIGNYESYEIYYLNSSYKNTVVGNFKDIDLVTPDGLNGIYNLYIMVSDYAGNVSFKDIKNIYIDSQGPSIIMSDISGNVTNGGSSEYITVFNYNIDIEETESKLDLNSVYYKWINSSNDEAVFSKHYTNCSFDYSVCRIKNDEIEMQEGLFSPTSSYRLVVIASDSAGNTSTYTSNAFKIDTTAPVVTFDVEDKWYNGSFNAKFSVSKSNNAGTLNDISYCLNDCFNETEYDFSKFKNLSVSNYTNDAKQVPLSLNNGINVLYVKAGDVFGNTVIATQEIKYDSLVSIIDVINMNEAGLVDVSEQENSVIEFDINDEHSGIKKYCIYYENDILNCYDNINVNHVIREYEVIRNGNYYIEVYDLVNNVTKYNVKVVGADKEPISFNLVSDIANGKFTNSLVTISLTNMRKFMIDDVSDLIKTIDYISVNEYTSDYSDMFVSCINVYDKEVNNTLVTSFAVSENKIYVVRVVDVSNNVSYNTISITNIDKTKPFIDHDSNKIYLTTSSGNNIAKMSESSYKYANDTLIIKFSKDSLKDEYNGYNSYLAVKVCFDEGNGCTYNAYNVNSVVNGLYVVNNALVSVSAPYHFSGVIRYYLVDGAGNASNEYSLNVTYVSEPQDVEVVLKDVLGNNIDSSSKYNKVIATLENYTSEVDVKYALVSSNVDLEYEFINKSSLANFLSYYSFINVTTSEFEVTKNSVDMSYYMWIYVSDVYGNYKLFNTGDLIRLDSIAPTFEEIGYSINRVESNSYELVVNKNIYEMFIDLNNDDVYEKVNLVENKYNFSVSGVSSISLKLKDSAGNESSKLVVDLSGISSGIYGRVYQNGNNRQATIIIYNMGNNNISLFKYIVSSVDSSDVFDASSIDYVDACVGNETDCYKNTYSTSSKGVYTVSISEDRKLVFYVYVAGSLVLDKNGKVLEIDLAKDDTNPQILYSDLNPVVVSTKNGENYLFNLTVNEDNLSKLNDHKFILTKTTSISASAFEASYNSCVNSSSCMRGLYDLDSNHNGVISIGYNELATGVYYLYTYIEDDYGNKAVIRSNSIYVDNSSPTISYNSSNSSYSEIDSNLFATKAVTLRFSDDKQIKYFEVFNASEELIARCDIDSVSLNYECSREDYILDGNSVLYELDTGNYQVVVYDMVNNSKMVNISIDSDIPVVELYKYLDSSYVKQPAGEKLYNSLDNLYLKIVEDNFSYLVIDLYNTTSGVEVKDAVRYSYNSQVGRELLENTYGKALNEVLVTNIEYNKIVIKAYDKANRCGELVINYDDITPIIWVKDVKESIKVDGSFYEINDGYKINFEIGVNKSITLDKVLSEFIVNVDGMNYMSAKNSDLLHVTVYKKVSSNYSLFEQNLFDYIGEYKIEISYTDNAGNVAESKQLYISLVDNTNPEITFDGIDDVVELNDEVSIPLVKVSDNYGLDSNKTKEILLGLEDASCVIEGVDCSNYIDGEKGTYKFNKVGIYEFSYAVSDISSNSVTFGFVIEVRDTKGPNITSNEQTSRTLYVGERNVDSSINVSNVTLAYPMSFDIGDNNSKTVTYLGLFALNASNEKYKVVDDVYIVSDVSGVLTYRFNKIGSYYLRFASIDNSGNSSTFEYEVIVKDMIKPVINGVSQGQVVELDLDLGSSYDVSTIISNYNIVVSDNYDDNIKLNYLKNGNEITFSATDASGNTVNVTVIVQLIDRDPPVVGSLKVATSTNNKELYFEVIGGSDNSSEWGHQYSVDNINWETYKKGESKLLFGEGVNVIVNLCIRAFDTRNISQDKVCQNVIVDTQAPVISGVSEGEILTKAVSVQISDSNLVKAILYKNGEKIDLNINNLPYSIEEEGNYYIEAIDSMGNVSKVSFIINVDTHVNVVNDINAPQYTTTAVEFDERLLVKVNVNYDENGDSSMSINLASLDVNKKSMIYILGVVPDTSLTFVIYSFNGANVNQYSDITLIAEGKTFKDGVNNEECFVKIGDSYYAYLVVKQLDENIHTTETSNVTSNEDNSGLLKTLLIIIGSLLTLVVGYQIIKLKRRVRAA